MLIYDIPKKHNACRRGYGSGRQTGMELYLRKGAMDTLYQTERILPPLLLRRIAEPRAPNALSFCTGAQKSRFDRSVCAAIYLCAWSHD